MGHRELRRVPLDFHWPLNTVWGGYRDPFYTQSEKCDACDGTGESPEYKRLGDEWYGYASFDPAAYGATPITVDHPSIVRLAERNYPSGSPGIVRAEARRLHDHMRGQWSHHLIQADVDALIEAGRLMDFTHTPRTPEQVAIVKAKIAAGGNSWLPKPNGYTPTADEVNAWSIGGMGHDSINRWVCVKARAKREGITSQHCPRCVEGRIWPSEKIRKQSARWKATKPPTGEGFQLWETCSEGSPVSPVFATLDDLCGYAAAHCTTFASHKASAEQWRAMLDEGYVRHVEKFGNVTVVC